MKKPGAKNQLGRIVGNERGSIALDFLFASMIAFGFSSVFFAITVSLSLVEVGQYVTYSTSRAFAGAHETLDLQKEQADKKYKEIMGRGIFKNFMGPTWVKLGKPVIGDFNQDYGVSDDADMFWGVQIPMDAVILRLRVPFLGPTFEDAKVGQATLNSYLGHEVPTAECREKFTVPRFQQLLSKGVYSGAPSPKYFAFTDNGC